MSSAPFNLDPALIQRLRDLAARENRPVEDVVRDAVERYERNGTTVSSNGQAAPTSDSQAAPPQQYETAYEAFKAAGAIGCFSGPGDASTNKKYFEGFGRE